ncbi:M12 family metallo-peptidase [Rubrivirga sp.]|uniref:M12 family metallo-peptidase n=1 Tax=Rubrivirga sp. TaxID=1885344 RepID=UPI003B52F0E5
MLRTLLALALVSGAAAQPVALQFSRVDADGVRPALALSGYDLVRVPPQDVVGVAPHSSGGLVLDVPRLGTVAMRKTAVLTDGAVVVAGRPGGDVPVRLEVATFASPDARSTATVAPGGVYGRFETDDHTYTLAPLAEAGPGAHVLYRADALLAPPPQCGVETGPPVQSGSRQQAAPDLYDLHRSRLLDGEPGTPPERRSTPAQPTGPPSQAFLDRVGAQMAGGAIDSVEVAVALEGDYEMFQEFGSVEAAAEWMVAQVAAASSIFERDAGTRLVVPYVRVWSDENDPYGPETDNGGLFDSFRDYWRDHMGHVDRTLAHYFSPKRPPSFDGIAFRDGLCSEDFGYGFTGRVSPESDRVRLFSHELGHNFGSPHTHSCFWPDGPIDYCVSVEGNCYAEPRVASEGTIMSYCRTRRLELHPTVRDYIRSRVEVAACAPSYVRQPLAASDVAALDDLYATTGGGAWVERDGWSEGGDVDRFGVAVRNGNVLAIRLPSNGLNGSVPASLSELTSVRELDLSRNELTGPLPTLDGMTGLRQLDLSYNGFTGPLPSVEGSAESIEVVDLFWNSFTGSIPASYTRARNLRYLELSLNDLSGGVPTELVELPRLVSLFLSHTSIGGEFPTPRDVSAVQYLRLGGAALTGPFPTDLSGYPELGGLALSDNGFDPGPLPESFRSESVFSLRVDRTSRTGPFPDLTDSFPVLSDLHAGENDFDPGPIPEWLRWARGSSDPYPWYALAIEGTNRTGPIPEWLGALPTLRWLNLGKNDLEGPLPDEIADATNLSTLYVYRNPRLSGPLPIDLTRLNLRFLNYRDTNLCVPDDEAFHAWLDGLQSHWGSDLSCMGVPSDDGPDAADAVSLPAPNPAARTATLTVTASQPQDLRVEVYDSIGRRVSGWTEPVTAGVAHEVRIDTSLLPSGTYLVRVAGDTLRRTRTLTVTR